MTQLLSQQTVRQGVERWTVETEALTPFAARQKTRLFVRRHNFTLIDILSPEVVGVKGQQTKIPDFFPEGFAREEYEVVVEVKTPFFEEKTDDKWWVPDQQ